MNIKRGLHRIIIVIATISIIPSFLIGTEKYSKYKRTEIKVIPIKICDEKTVNITPSTLKDWQIEPPYKDWVVSPMFFPIAEGAIAHKKNTDNYWILKDGKWKRWYPEGSLSPKGKFIVQGGKWVEVPRTAINPKTNERLILQDGKWSDLIEIDEEAPLGYQKVVYVAFYPSRKNCLIAGSLTAIISFSIILFGIMGLIRLIGWIIAGFKDNINRS